MEVRELTTYEYITKDGKTFTDKSQAYKHEYELIVQDIDNRTIRVGEYDVLTINSKEELMALKMNADAEDTFLMNVEDVNQFPYYICRSYDDEYCFCYYKDMNKVITYQEKVLNELKNILNNK